VFFVLTMSSTCRPTLRSASMRAFHSTGSFCTLAAISVGDSSFASSPTLLFTSPAGANGRCTFSR
jgi:hypothetical protein